jgi:hypothetical protein
MDYYYLEVSIEDKIVHTEIFKSDTDNATKYIAYKEQLIRENKNFLRKESDLLLVTSKYYKHTEVHVLKTEELNNMEKILQEANELRIKILEMFRKFKDYIN